MLVLGMGSPRKGGDTEILTKLALDPCPKEGLSMGLIGFYHDVSTSGDQDYSEEIRWNPVSRQWGRSLWIILDISIPMALWRIWKK